MFVKKTMFYFVFVLFFSTSIYAGQGEFALTFDGIDDYVVTGDGPDLSDDVFTMEFWAKRNDVTDIDCFIGQGNTNVNNQCFYFGIESDGRVFAFQVGHGNGVYSAPVSDNDTKWHHFAVAKNGTNHILIYRDGKLIVDDNTSLEDFEPVSNNLCLGVSPWSLANPNQVWHLDGYLDEVRVWNDVRSAEEIRENMYKDVTGQIGLEAYYKMSDGSGASLTDNSANSYTGTLTNGTTWTTSGCFGGSRQALAFDGTNDYITTATGPVLDDDNTFTMECWAKTDQLNDADVFISQGNIGNAANNGKSFYFGMRSSNTMYVAQIGLSSLVQSDPSTPFEDTGWHHYAVVLNGNIVIGYRDGEKVLEGDMGVSYNASSDRLVIGSTPWITNYKHGGCIDEVRVWSDIRTQAEIQENMMKTLVGNEAGLEAYYRFDQMDGTTLYDMTGHGYNGTLNNMDANTDWVDGGAFSTWIGTESSDWSDCANWTDGPPAPNQSAGIYDWTVGGLTTYEATISGGPSMNHLFLSSSSTPTMSSGITLGGSLILRRDLNQSMYNIRLGNHGYLTETSGELSGSTGYIETVWDLDNVSGLDVGNLGAVITTAENMSNTTVRRGYSHQSGTGLSKSINRYYDIIPTNNSGLNATLVFNYKDSELNGITETDLELHKSTDGGTTWSNENGTVTTGFNILSLTGISEFSRWTGGVSAEMKVEGNGQEISDGDNTYDTVDDTDFGEVKHAGSNTISKTFTIYNTGAADLILNNAPYVTFNGGNAGDFSVTSQPASPIAAGGNSSFTVEFDPSASGERVTNVSIANNDSDENPYTFEIGGDGLAPEMKVEGNGAEITDGDLAPVDTDDTDFGSTDISGGSVEHTFTIRNTGDAELLLNGPPKVAITGHTADFTVTLQPNSPVAASGGNTTFKIEFDPTAAGDRFATVSIANNDDDENPYNFAIKGTGVTSPEIMVKGNGTEIPNGDVTPGAGDDTYFGQAGIGVNTIEKTFTIRNTGSADLNLTGAPIVEIGGDHPGDFTVTEQAATPVASGGGEKTFKIKFNPTAAGDRFATVSIANNDSDENPYTYKIKGEGVYSTPLVTTSPAENISSTSAKLKGTVNPNNFETTVVFEWGLDDTYGNSVTASQSPLTGAAAQTVSYTLTGLSPSTTYHYRAKGSNANGAETGADKSFTTPRMAPVLTKNEGLVLCKGEERLIGNSLLLCEDGDNTAAELVYTLEESPAKGDLLLGGSVLTDGATFTQEDVDNNAIKYKHGGGTGESDRFRFTVSDGQGGTVPLTTFSIVVNSRPEVPVLISGPSELSQFEEGTFIVKSSDPEGGRVRYRVKWEGSTWEWSSWAASGTEAELTYAWEKAGTYEVGVKVSDEHGVFSDGVLTFTVTVNSPLKIISPNGGERLEALSLAEVKVSTGEYDGGVDILYSTDGGGTYREAILGRKDNQVSYAWRVPDEVSEECLLKAVLKNDVNYFDVSDAFFAIVPQRKIAVVSPQEGDLVEGGEELTTRWTSQGDMDRVDLFYSVDGGTEFMEIVEAEENDGEFVWRVPELNAGEAVFRVCRSGNGDVKGESGKFEIYHDEIEITCPEKEVNWQVGRTYPIRWEFAGKARLVDLYFDHASGLEKIAGNIDIGKKEYQWTVPESCLDFQKGRIVIVMVDANVQDESPLVRLEEYRALELLTPEDGESYYAGRPISITWRNSDNVKKVNIHVRKSGSGGFEFVSSVSSEDGSYLWEGLKSPSEECVVLIQDDANREEVGDSNEVPFRVIAAPDLSFTNEFFSSYYEEDSLLLTWKKQEEETDLLFSGNGGTTWDTVAYRLPANSHSCSYRFPKGRKDSCLFKVHLSFSPEIYDISPYFSVETKELTGAKIIRPSEDTVVFRDDSVIFQGEDPDEADSYHWDFANGETSSELIPGAVRYENVGEYQAVFYYTQGERSSPKDSVKITVVERPVEELPPAKIVLPGVEEFALRGDSLYFKGKEVDLSGLDIVDYHRNNLSYHWIFPGPEEARGADLGYVSFPSLGEFTVYYYYEYQFPSGAVRSPSDSVKITVKNILEDIPLDFITTPYHYYSQEEVWLKWSTNEASSGLVQYGTNKENLDLSLSLDTMRVEHHVTIPGIMKNQNYYYHVKAFEGDEQIVSAVDSFGIKEVRPLDEKAPFAVFQWIFPYEREALLLFRVNEPARGELVYGTERGAWSDTVKLEGFKYNHVYELDDLEPNTIYYFELKLTDLAGNTGYFPKRNGLARKSGISNEGSFFSTGDEEDIRAPEFSAGPEFFLNSKHAVGLYWETDEPTLMKVEIWKGNDLLSHYRDMENYRLSRNFHVSGLDKGESYRFKVRVFDLSGNETSWFSDMTEVEDCEINPPTMTLSPFHEVENGILRVRWETDIPSISEVRWGYSSEELTERFRRTEMKKRHEIFINQLDLTRKIYYQARSGVDTAYCPWSEILAFNPAVSIDETEEDLTGKTLFKISAYPNPFSHEMNMEIYLKDPGLVKLEVFNTLGESVRKLLERDFASGNHEIAWNGKDEDGRELSSGVYLVNMSYRKIEEKRNRRQVLKVLLIR